MAFSRIHEFLCLLLDHGNRDVLFSVAGCLINLSSDATLRALLLKEGAAQGLAELLQISTFTGDIDISLCAVACKAIFNFCVVNETHGTGSTSFTTSHYTVTNLK